MIDIHSLSIGCHILAGKEYDTFSVPKHYVVVKGITEHSVICEDMTPEAKSCEYEAKDLEGISITDALLEKNEFVQSKVCHTKYYYQNNKTGDRIVVDKFGYCTASGKVTVIIGDIFTLHQLERVTFDAKINKQYQLL